VEQWQGLVEQYRLFVGPAMTMGADLLDCLIKTRAMYLIDDILDEDASDALDSVLAVCKKQLRVWRECLRPGCTDELEQNLVKIIAKDMKFVEDGIANNTVAIEEALVMAGDFRSNLVELDEKHNRDIMQQLVNMTKAWQTHGHTAKLTTCLAQLTDAAVTNDVIEDVHKSLQGVGDPSPEVHAHLQRGMPKILKWLEGGPVNCNFGTISKVLAIAPADGAHPFQALCEKMQQVQDGLNARSASGTPFLGKCAKAILNARQEASLPAGNAALVTFRQFAAQKIEEWANTFKDLLSVELNKTVDKLVLSSLALEKVAGGAPGGRKWHENGSSDDILSIYSVTLQNADKDQIEKLIQEVGAAKAACEGTLANHRAALPLAADAESLAPSMKAELAQASVVLIRAEVTKTESLLCQTLIRKRSKHTKDRCAGFTSSLSHSVQQDWTLIVNTDLVLLTKEALA
jgi:hypothetical protein